MASPAETERMQTLSVGNKQGFTLFELLIVLVIVGLMSSLIAPNLFGNIGRMNLKTAAKSIAASLRYARSLAASEKITYLALFDFEKHSFSLLNEKNPDDVKVYHLPEGVRFQKAISASAKENMQSGIFRICFFPNGSGSGGEVILADERGSQYVIRVHFITGITELKEL